MLVQVLNFVIEANTCVHFIIMLDDQSLSVGWSVAVSAVLKVVVDAGANSSLSQDKLPVQRQTNIDSQTNMCDWLN